MSRRERQGAGYELQQALQCKSGPQGGAGRKRRGRRRRERANSGGEERSGAARVRVRRRRRWGCRGSTSEPQTPIRDTGGDRPAAGGPGDGDRGTRPPPGCAGRATTGEGGPTGPEGRIPHREARTATRGRDTPIPRAVTAPDRAGPTAPCVKAAREGRGPTQRGISPDGRRGPGKRGRPSGAALPQEAAGGRGTGQGAKGTERGHRQKGDTDRKGTPREEAAPEGRPVGHPLAGQRARTGTLEALRRARRQNRHRGLEPERPPHRLVPPPPEPCLLLGPGPGRAARAREGRHVAPPGRTEAPGDHRTVGADGD